MTSPNEMAAYAFERVMTPPYKRVNGKCSGAWQKPGFAGPWLSGNQTHDGSKAVSLSDVVRGLPRQTASKAVAGVRISIGKLIQLEAARIVRTDTGRGSEQTSRWHRTAGQREVRP
jgi:hypothetical protein